ncbi:hypothetical protein [Companilactobacillus kimchiensis]|nr:hypothetical protein [Companilactobacillus kimchiensis]
MRKLRYALLVLVGVLFVSFLTGCHKEIKGQFIGEGSNNYIVIKVDNNKGEAQKIPNSTLRAMANGSDTENVSVDKGKITIGSDTYGYKIQNKNVVLDNGVTLYAEKSDEAKRIQNKMSSAVNNGGL